MSSDKWLPGMPSGRIHVETASATGFGGELFKRYGISLAGVSFQTTQVRDKVSRTRTRIEGFVLAPPLRGLEGLSVAHGPAVDGPQGSQGSISTAMARKTAPRAS